MPETIRAFIAIELNPQIRDELSLVQSQLKTADADVKWVKPESIHLTLKFLGNISNQKVGEVKNLLDLVSPDHGSFELSLFKIGCFPKLEYPRVIWVGIDKGCSESESLAKAIEEESAKIGFAKESRPYAAHLTLGRVRSAKGKGALVSKIKTLDFKPSAVSAIDRLTLFQSTLSPKGSIYTPLHEARLS